MASTNGSFSWELHTSDLKISRMVIKRELPTVRFDIPIPRQAPKHKPGSCPPPPRVDLRLVHDINAYIIDKIVLPLEPFTQLHDPRQRRVYYIVGWPDLPAARPVIIATQILDYVSPRALEDWEYQDALRREEAREAEERALEKGKGMAVPGKPGPKPGMKRKPGRPPRARLMDAPPPELVLNSDQEEMLQRRKSGPSLSTPQKSRLAQLVAEEEMLEQLEDVEEENPVSMSVIQRQLQGEVVSETDVDLDTDVDMEDARGVGPLRSSSPVSVVTSGQMSRASSSRPGPSKKPSLAPADYLATSAAATNATTRGSPHRAHDRSSRDPLRSPASRLPQSSIKQPISDNSVSLLPYFSRPTVSKTVFMKEPSSPRSKDVSQVKPQFNSVMSSLEMNTPAGNGHGQRSLSQLPETTEDIIERHSSSMNPSPSRADGFTPIGGTFPRPPKRHAEEDPSAASTPASTQSKERMKKQPKLSQPPSDRDLNDENRGAAKTAEALVQMPQDYVVRRLEGDNVLDGVHWFRVRWKGSWPPGQNPTWEPKENISAKLVKEYLKRKSKRETEKSSKNNTPNATSSSTEKSKQKRQSSLAEWAKSYNSVSEAFEGKAELDATTDAMLGRRGNLEPDDEDDDFNDELIVVEPNKVEDREKAARERKKRLDAQLAAQLASMARRGPREY